MTMVGRHM